MSRIEDALKRVTGAAADERSSASLEAYTAEKAPKTEPIRPPKHEPATISSFAPPSAADLRMPPPMAPSIAEPEHPPVHLEETADGAADADVEQLIDFSQIANYAGFLGRSLGRHKMLAVVTVVLVLAMTVAAARLMPKTYHVGTKLLAQRNAVMAALSNPGRAVPWDADAPTRAAAETVLKRDNLIALIKQTNAMEEWERTRAPVLRLKDWLMPYITGHTPTAEEKLEAMIGLLESRMIVVAGPVGDGTVTIDLDWPDPQTAFHLVEGAQQAFLEARQKAETAAIGESIAILERYSASLHDDVNRTLSELQRTQRGFAPARLSTARTRLSLAGGLPTVVTTTGNTSLDAALDANPENSRLKSVIADKRTELTRLEETRQRQLSDAQGRLAQLMTVYTASHPSVLSAQQNITALSRETPQAVTLRAEIDEMQRELDARMSTAADEQIKASLDRSNAAAQKARAADEAAARQEQAAQAQQDTVDRTGNKDVAEFATLRLRSELNQLESVLERTDGARIELAVSQAAFKYRYSVIRPAQVPRNPIRPDIRLVVAGGIIGALLMMLVAVVGRDMLSRRILESWQVERQLGLPILGSLGNV